MQTAAFLPRRTAVFVKGTPYQVLPKDVVTLLSVYFALGGLHVPCLSL